MVMMEKINPHPECIIDVRVMNNFLTYINATYQSYHVLNQTDFRTYFLLYLNEKNNEKIISYAFGIVSKIM